MCGIVGLLIKNPAWRDRLGELMVPMLIGMTERGPDSAGLAVYTEPVSGALHKLSLSGAHGSEIAWNEVLVQLTNALPNEHEMVSIANHAVLTTATDPQRVQTWLSEKWPQIAILSVGKAIDLYKDVGTPAQVAQRYHFAELRGSHLVGHTRMATESAVTTAHAHPFAAGRDFCLVHNGSLSNPHLIRRKLEPLGIRFDTDNDTEAACRYLEWRLREGDTLQQALHHGFAALDGFFTFLMGTQKELALVRDPFACKPAIVADNEHYVAIASEFRSLAHLPDVANAVIFEPKPEEIYTWRI